MTDLINSIEEFITKAQHSSNEEIFKIFEHETTEEVRTKIYALADKGSNEPFRNAMFNLGFKSY